MPTTAIANRTPATMPIVRAEIPPAQSTARMLTAQIAMVPRSDCVTYKNAIGTAIWTKMLATNIRTSISPVRNSWIARAAASTNAIFANSDGCKLTGPSCSQRVAPSSSVPIRAVRTISMTASAHMTSVQRVSHFW